MGNCQTSLVYWTLYNGFDLSMGRGYLGLLFLIDPGMACIIYIYEFASKLPFFCEGSWDTS